MGTVLLYIPLKNIRKSLYDLFIYFNMYRRGVFKTLPNI